MKIHPPCIITPRLLAGVQIGQSFISIEYADRAGDEHRVRYRYYIDSPEFNHEGDDLQSGCHHSLMNGLGSLLSFLSSSAEAYRYEDSENSELFPPDVMYWAYLNADDISMLACWMDENSKCIEE